MCVSRKDFKEVCVEIFKNIDIVLFCIVRFNGQKYILEFTYMPRFKLMLKPLLYVIVQ